MDENELDSMLDDLADDMLDDIQENRSTEAEIRRNVAVQSSVQLNPLPMDMNAMMTQMMPMVSQLFGNAQPPTNLLENKDWKTMITDVIGFQKGMAWIQTIEKDQKRQEAEEYRRLPRKLSHAYNGKLTKSKNNEEQKDHSIICYSLFLDLIKKVMESVLSKNKTRIGMKYLKDMNPQEKKDLLKLFRLKIMKEIMKYTRNDKDYQSGSKDGKFQSIQRLVQA